MKKKKNKIIYYGIELIIITLGLSLSFLIEYKREVGYKENLKTQSLNRILKNLEVDNLDYSFNTNAHLDAINAIDWITLNYKSLENYPKDSIGYYIQNAMFISTTFYDNQEEYRSLQNSGLIEFIDNEEIVIGLQNKYVDHEYMKHLEDEIDKYVFFLKEFRYENIFLKSNNTNSRGYPIDVSYVGNYIFPTGIIQALRDKRWWHSLYIKRINNLTKTDEVLISKILEEIN